MRPGITDVRARYRAAVRRLRNTEVEAGGAEGKREEEEEGRAK